MRISLIVAMAENRVIGCDGALPWRLSADLQRFKRLTMGHHIAMGRKTYESIGRLLPGRQSIVITRQNDLEVPGAKMAHDLAEVRQLAAGDDELFIIGGGEIYQQALRFVDRIYLTLVHTEVSGDTLFPEFESGPWEQIEQVRHLTDEKNELDYSFMIYDRVRDSGTSCVFQS